MGDHLWRPRESDHLSTALEKELGKLVRFSSLAQVHSFQCSHPAVNVTLGSYDYKSLPLPNSTESFDPQLVASTCYNASTAELVSYDTLESAKMKAEWIKQNGLGGCMFWELSFVSFFSPSRAPHSILSHFLRGDHKEGHERAIVPAVAKILGPLDPKLNHLDYSDSKFNNLRNQMK
jgi:chitinase